MGHIPRACLARHEPQKIRGHDGTSFKWSLAKIRIAGLVLLGAAMPAVAGLLLVSVTLVTWLCLAWLLGVALLMRGLSRRASDNSVVLSVDQRGLLDLRLMPRHIAWQEIEAVSPVNTCRNHTVDIRLRWPKTTLRQTRWLVRIGAYCQTAYGVPGVTISMLLVEGTVAELLNAVAKYRPHLLHYTNRGSRLAVR
jgi:hypothetical protein